MILIYTTLRNLWGRYFIILCSSICAVVLFNNCTGLKNISIEDPLLYSSDINITRKLESDNPRELKNELIDINLPKPNSRVLWMRPGLSVYTSVGKVNKEKGIKHWIKNNLGSPPVTLSEVYPENTKEAIENRMFNYGYFNAVATHEIKKRTPKTVEIRYNVEPGDHYRFDSIRFSTRVDPLGLKIASLKKNTLIKSGRSYKLNTLIEERDRVEAELKNSGYYYFSQDYLLFRADTFTLSKRVRLNLRIKPDIPESASKVMKIGKVYVQDDYRVENYFPDTTFIEGNYFISQDHDTRPEVILDKVHLKTGENYSRTLHFRTLSHLASFGMYRYVNAEFREDTTNNLLHTYLYMTPLKRNSVSAELNAVIRTTNYVGPGINLNWRNRNIFGGAEMFIMNINGSFEFQVGADSINTSYEIGFDAGLEIPRLIPFEIGKVAPQYIPLTSLKMGANLYRRVELYTLNSFFLHFGYKWRQSQTFNHDLRIFDLSFSNLSDQTDAFRNYLEQNPIVKRSFEEQFLIGTAYSITFDRLNSPDKTNIFVNGTVETAGNVLSLISNATGNGSESINNFFGVPYSQFIKLKGEYRHYFNIGRNNQLVARTVLGAGFPYGNSEILPYFRQFFAGGTNSIRAFVSRSVGPGSFNPPVENLGVDQTGDIKLEANLEYRLSFSRLFKGAIFVDAGNVWLKNPDPERVGADFELNRFWKEIALGSGIGFRIDVDFVVFRLDLAFKMYRPDFPEGNRWVLDQFNPLSSQWRKDNLLLNIAIGYPF